MDYEKAKRIMNKHEVTLFDKISGTFFYPLLIIKWYKIAKKDKVSFKQANRVYWSILFK